MQNTRLNKSLHDLKILKYELISWYRKQHSVTSEYVSKKHIKVSKQLFYN